MGHGSGLFDVGPVAGMGHWVVRTLANRGATTSRRSFATAGARAGDVPIRGRDARIFEVVSHAKYFVHFSSWGLSHQLIGALKIASARVPDYGFASNVDSNTRAELTEYQTETPRLIAKAIPTNLYNTPHQKLLIVDGLVAFKGSANLTNTGLRKADRGLDIHETITDYGDVTNLNNIYFAPVWRRITAPEDVFCPYVDEVF